MVKGIVNKTDVIESCSGGRMNTKERFYNFTNLTVFAVFLKDVTTGWKDAVLRESLLNKCTINCLTFGETTKQPQNDNLSFFRAPASFYTEINNWMKELQNFSSNS